ncbi:MAG: hypothetical protein UV82_C0008G0009 [Candidatus Magasanikbacteria bacterium GW2011_GWD2_43_18]|nr:MAG: hypothetical protein UV18_C0019G0002 [Candidatus Magasanikbacteria bacterium GW2011_GWC2_42_27]KKT04405.1 MAG: hypothetical protein UV82_C0008G0009 [Candidatus Magasanikbacteria bacterium GW2011_GWD2_43_18]KKT25162.1 MAG: hypothetical protein UW10_C0013G0019 [Candidatus Magasanikbacteria bacterium GW2011_GWA2_43_9]HBB37634.1 hypothetical protein [Candidatus Magasanikbacteria bacterium]HCC13517.1 hypothetical protein [Candidatus Magasanikbacteria bacterium]
MKTTRSINLGGYAFTIDEDAYQALQSYLERLRAHFRLDEGREEILIDIESRIAESFIRIREGGREVIEMQHIEDIIKAMGDVQDLSDEPQQAKNEYTSSRQEFAQKKLYKDPEHAMIGGVAAGIAAYFNIDPALVRLAFVLLVFAGGSGFIIYLVLLFILPDADTPLKQSELRGESPTIQDIEKKVKEMIEKSKQKISEIDTEHTKQAVQDAMQKTAHTVEESMKKATQTVTAASKRVSVTTKVGANSAGKTLVRIVSLLLGIGLLVTGVAGVIGISILCYTALLGGIESFSFIPGLALYTASFYTPLFLGSLWLTIALPFAFFLSLGIALVSRRPLKLRFLFVTMLILWMIAITVLGGLLLHIVLPRL